MRFNRLIFKKKKLLLGFLLVLLGCTPALYMPTANDASEAKTSLDTLIMGRKLYINNCGSCHNLYAPHEYSQAEWVKILPKMRKKAELTEAQAAFIKEFLLARCKKPKTT